MHRFKHSVTLIKEKCRGCTNCIKRCPMEAMRVRAGKANVIADRCIDCGECITGCPYHAIKSKVNQLDDIKLYKYTIAIADTALYGQFRNLSETGIVLEGLRELGFDEVFEAPRAGAVVSELTRSILQEGKMPKPVISSSCPAVTRLIRVRFANLCDHVLPVLTPAELSGFIARDEAVKKTGLNAEEIGIFYISPCPAKATAQQMPLGSMKSNLDKVLSINEIYPKLLLTMKNVAANPVAKSKYTTARFSYIGGEASALKPAKTVSADGMENVIRLLEEIEDEMLEEFDFIELHACSSGCVGGILNVENPFIAVPHIKMLEEKKEQDHSQMLSRDLSIYGQRAMWEVPLEYAPVLKLDDDMGAAMNKLHAIESILESLPGLDCGSCGAPSCKALAEDIVRGNATQLDCVFRLRELGT